MATEPTSSRRETLRRDARRRQREPSLRPARWSGRLRPGTLLRAALVAALLALAVGLTFTQEPVICAGGTGPAGSAGPVTSAGPASSAGPVTSAGPAGPRPGAVADPPGGPGPLPIPRGLVGVPVRLAEPAAADVVRPGGRVDLLALPVGTARTTVEQPTVLASAALVLDVLTGGGDAPAALVLALEPAQARRAVGQPETTRFAVVLR